MISFAADSLYAVVIRVRAGRSRGSLLAAAVASLLASSCVPVSESYFAPSAPFGETESYHAHCGGAPEIIVFTPENHDHIVVRFGVKYPDSRKPDQVAVSMAIEKRVPWEFLLFPSIEAQKQRSDRDRAIMEQPVVIDAAAGAVHVSWENGGNAMLPIEFLDGNSRVVLGASPKRFCTIISNFSGDWMLLEPPTLTFDGVPLDLPPIRFTWSEGIFISPINC